MPNYVNALVNPGDAMQGSLNTLAGVKRSRQLDNQLNQSQQRLDIEKQDAYIRGVGVPLRFQQMKSQNMADIATKIMQLPQDQRFQRYRDLIEKVAPMPIATNDKLGPLGVVDPKYYIDPETFKNMAPDKQDDYLKTIAYDHKAIADLDLTTKKGFLQAEKIAKEYENKKDLILYGEQSDMRLMKQRHEYDVSNATLAHKNTMELEQARAERPKSTLSSDPEMIDKLAKQVADGRLDPNMISKRGGLQQSVFAKLEDIAPGFDIVGANANAKYATNPSNLQSRALINGVEPLYDRLLEVGKDLNNKDLQTYNKARNWLKEKTGDPDIVAFNNLRDDVVAESERILMGSGVLSDSKYLRAVKNVNSAQSYPQLQAAVKQLRLTIKSRLEALNKAPYPETNPNRPPSESRVSGSSGGPAPGAAMTAEDYLKKFRRE